MATSRATGARMVFEVQYTYEPAHVWRERHEWYRDRGIVDVWLFGHTGGHMTTQGPDGVLLNPTHRAVLDSGSPVLWFNPFDLTLATAITYETPRHGSGGELKVAATGSGRLVVVSLDEARVTRDGLRTALLDELDANEAELTRLRTALKDAASSLGTAPVVSALTAPVVKPQRVTKREPEPESEEVALKRERRKARWAQRVADRQAREAAITAERERVKEQERRDERRREVHHRWVSDPLRQHLGDVYGDLPPVLHLPYQVDPADLGVAHQHWRAVIVVDVLTAPVESVVDVEMMLGALDRRGIEYSRTEMVNEMQSWVRALEQRGIVQSTFGGYAITGAVPGPRPVPDLDRTVRPVTRLCVACGLPLAQVLADQGLRAHPVDTCDPVARRRVSGHR